jgi:hypothetical protein
MGGVGSGFSGVAKKTVDEVFQLTADILARKGFLRPGARVIGSWFWSQGEERLASITVDSQCDLERPRLMLRYTWGGSEQLEYPVELESTVPNYGGLRWWFRCPAAGCGRRVGKLYLAGKLFVCRVCGDLTYESCQKNHEFYSLFKRLGENMNCSPEMVRRALKEMSR